MRGSIEMEIRDVKRIGDLDEAVDAIVRLAEAAEDINNRLSAVEEYHAQEQIRFRTLIANLEHNMQERGA